MILTIVQFDMLVSNALQYFVAAGPEQGSYFHPQKVPALRSFWDLEQTVLHENRVSGAVVSPLLTQKSPTCTYISQKPW